MYLNRRRYKPIPRKATEPVIAELLALVNPNRDIFHYNQVVEIAEALMSAAADDDEQFKERCNRLLALAWTA